MILPAFPPSVVAVPAPPACRAAGLSLATDAQGGAFDGMSHAGTALLIRNTGRRACSLGGLPRVGFAGARGAILPIVRRVPVGMHPGPVVPALRLAPGATATTGLRWVSGEVFDRSRCFSPARIVVTIGRESLRVPLTARLCGPADAAATFDQPPLAILDPAH